MPEIAEAARIVHFLRRHLVGKRIEKVIAIEDSNVFGKAGTTGEAFAAAVSGKKVVSAGSQGKYFWIVLDSPPHPVLHFGMTGWIHIKGMRTGYTNFYNKTKPDEIDQWPPKFWKFQLETETEKAGKEPVLLAYTDPRRFGRVRLVHCPGPRIREFSPLAENGPDPVVDVDRFTEELVRETMRRRHVPIKALLLDQTFISGIGNWVGDEVLFQARLHPEQYCDTFTDGQIQQLHASICHVCRTAVSVLGDSDQFPADWLFHYRWGKGKSSSKSSSKGGKDQETVTRLPSGEKLEFLTVGGRTSCFAPSLQKKGGGVVPVALAEPAVVVQTNLKKKALAAWKQVAKDEEATKDEEAAEAQRLPAEDRRRPSSPRPKNRPKSIPGIPMEQYAAPTPKRKRASRAMEGPDESLRSPKKEKRQGVSGEHQTVVHASPRRSARLCRY